MTKKIIVIGASAGGLSAVDEVLASLSADYSHPIVLVLHLKQEARIDFAQLFARRCKLKVMEADEKQRPAAGCLYVAPPGYHLLFEDDRTFALSVDDLVNWARPSIDVLFETAAEVFTKDLVGIILTGANHDGALGLRRVQEHGGVTVVQEPQSAEFPAMPNAALSLLSPDHVLTPSAIGELLATL